MRKILRGMVVVGCVLMSACAITEPVVVIGHGGLILRGSTTARLSGSGSFSATNGTLTCGGSYNSLDMSTTISMQVICSDGRKGFITATRDASGTSGNGTATLTDGTEWKFIFGPAAANF